VTQPASAATSRTRRYAPALIWLAVIAVLGLVLAPGLRAVGAEFAAGRVRPHLPDGTLWFSQSIAIQLHVYAAVTAFVIGLVMLARVKGDKWHRWIGWAWVVAMFVTAASSLFIMELNHGFYSFIHLISGWTLIALPMAIYAIRVKRNVVWHRQVMVGLFIGGMLIAGGLTLLPGRLMWRLFLG
jgi:uncharacterized membrane protein